MNKDVIRKILKNKNNQIICIILIIGVVFMLISGGGGEKDNVSKTTAAIDEEKRLEEILSQIDGAGEVSVMITYYGTSEKDIAYETKTNTVGQDLKSEKSEDKKAVMSDGEPMVLREIYPKAKGVIVTADGGGSAAVRQAISEAVTAVTDVPAHRVKIYKRQQ
jgi:stage III sporulation protein AG